jgi:hypothetical protein
MNGKVAGIVVSIGIVLAASAGAVRAQDSSRGAGSRRWLLLSARTCRAWSRLSPIAGACSIRAPLAWQTSRRGARFYFPTRHHESADILYAQPVRCPLNAGFPVNCYDVCAFLPQNAFDGHAASPVGPPSVIRSQKGSLILRTIFVSNTSQ